MMKILLEKRGEDVQLTEGVAKEIAENRHGRAIMEVLLNWRGNTLGFTREVLIAIAGSQYGIEVLEYIIEERGTDLHLTEEVVVAAAGNLNFGIRGIQKLLEVIPAVINDTAKLFDSAAASDREDVLRVLGQWFRNYVVAQQWLHSVQLRAAAEEGDTKTVLRLLELRTSPNKKDAEGITPLHYAAEGGHTDIVRLLLAANAVDVNSEDMSHRTPLFWPAAYGYIEVVKLLLDHGARQHYETTNGYSPLSIARERGQSDVVDLLEKHKAEDPDTHALQLQEVVVSSSGKRKLSYRSNSGTDTDWS
jgi:hypothetical protein